MFTLRALSDAGFQVLGKVKKPKVGGKIKLMEMDSKRLI